MEPLKSVQELARRLAILQFLAWKAASVLLGAAIIQGDVFALRSSIAVRAFVFIGNYLVLGRTNVPLFVLKPLKPFKAITTPSYLILATVQQRAKKCCWFRKKLKIGHHANNKEETDETKFLKC